ncbi:MAG TPA: N-acetylmuramoyl-L-alanine amidase [Candidatus Elarobacter sp.]|nr:N-acetylmuramoyl-L-alanine amidase [Candidatus Elarobacter sp.]
MNRSRVRAFSAVLIAALTIVAGGGARAQDRAPNLWFQGARLVFDRAVPMQGDLAVSTRDDGLRRFLDRLGASVTYQPQQRYVVITAEDRRTIAFTVGDPGYVVAGVRAQAPFAPIADGNDVVLPFFALARALYVEPVQNGSETVLQPRVGALDVRSDTTHTYVTVRGAMPLLTTTGADSPERLQFSIAGLGSSLAPSRRAPGSAVDEIEVAAGGSARVPTTTVTIAGARGTTHHVVPGDGPDAFTVVFERGPLAQAPPPGQNGSPPGLGPEYGPYGPSPEVAPTAAPPVVAGRATVTDLAIEPAAGDALAIRISLSGATTYEWHRLADNRWYIDFQNTTLTGPGRDERPSFGSVESVRVRQLGSSDAPSVRIAFTMTGEQRVDLAPSDTGLVISVFNEPAADLARSGTGQTGGDAITPSAAAVDSSPPSPWKFGASTNPKLIVIDPGHGGGDVGTQHNGLTEKVLTFDIAQRLRSLLVAGGWTVKMTRDTDIDPVSAENLARMHADGKPNADDRAYLQTRCDVANNAGARLFISIHINSAPVEGAHGSTFYWYKPQDASFAQALEKSVVAAAGTFDDGTRHENFYVVRHTTMPAVLIETAFVTNPGDVELLRRPSFLQNVAQGIANGVKAYAGVPSSNALSVQQ